MKTKKKPHRIKQKERKKHIAISIIAAVILVTIISVSSFLANSKLNQAINLPYQFKAAIVDHLSVAQQNQTFIQSATNTLRQAGYTVDYYPNENVTVEFYRDLPTHGYGLIILRVHSTTGGYLSVALFTSEHYSSSEYRDEQLADRLVPVAYSPEDAARGEGYFGITPAFVKSSMNGNFAKTVIIMMGCEGLNNTKMAQAFVEKGAKVYIGWNKMVSASHTDIAIAHLLQHFLTEKLTLKESVRETFREVGFDPAFSSLLIYYPLEVGDLTIENITGNQ